MPRRRMTTSCVRESANIGYTLNEYKPRRRAAPHVVIYAQRRADRDTKICAIFHHPQTARRGGVRFVPRIQLYLAAPILVWRPRRAYIVTLWLDILHAYVYRDRCFICAVVACHCGVYIVLMLCFCVQTSANVRERAP